MITRVTLGWMLALACQSFVALGQSPPPSEELGPPPPDPRSPLEPDAPASEQAAKPPPESAPLVSAPKLPHEQPLESRWYGWQTLLVDGAAIGTLFAAAGTESSELAILGVGTFYLGAPIVHFTHGNVGRGFGSLGLRVGAPLIVGAIGAGSADCNRDHEFCGFAEFAAGVAVGAALAVVVDAVALAYDSQPQPETGLRLSPSFGLHRNGGQIVLRGSL